MDRSLMWVTWLSYWEISVTSLSVGIFLKQCRCDLLPSLLWFQSTYVCVIVVWPVLQFSSPTDIMVELGCSSIWLQARWDGSACYLSVIISFPMIIHLVAVYMVYIFTLSRPFRKVLHNCQMFPIIIFNFRELSLCTSVKQSYTVFHGKVSTATTTTTKGS